MEELLKARLDVERCIRRQLDDALQSHRRCGNTRQRLVPCVLRSLEGPVGSPGSVMVDWVIDDLPEKQQRMPGIRGPVLHASRWVNVEVIGGVAHLRLN